MRNVALVVLLGSLAACAPMAIVDGDGSHGDQQAVADSGNIADRVRALPGVLGVSVRAPDQSVELGAGCTLYNVTFRQPLDHTATGGDAFTERLVLEHCGDDRPMIFSPDGYGMEEDFFQPELVNMFGANWLWAEHRYYGPSSPGSDPMGQFLTVRQSAADHHAIVAAFKQIYRAKWVSTGASNGGMNAVFHRRFYPNDVDGTVAYVAPFVIDYPDRRFPPFIETLGDDDCRARVVVFQRAVLTRRAELAKLLPPLGTFANPDSSLFWAGVSFRFAFWSYDGACDHVPAGDATGSELITALQRANVLEEDSVQAGFSPYNQQTTTELGQYQDDITGLEDLVGTSDDVVAPATYTPNTLYDVTQWITQESSHIAFIYGGHDPWTAAAGNPDPSRDALRVFAPNHGHDAELTGLTDQDREIVTSRISTWLQTTPLALQSATIELERGGHLRASLAMHRHVRTAR